MPSIKQFKLHDTVYKLESGDKAINVTVEETSTNNYDTMTITPSTLYNDQILLGGGKLMLSKT